MARPFDIVGYTYRADEYCPECILEIVRADHQHEHPNNLDAGIGPTTEATLNIYAVYLGIERFREETFDSGDFPKVVFREHLTDDDHDGAERCASCGRQLGGDS